MKWIIFFCLTMFILFSIGTIILGDYGEIGVALFFAVHAISYVIVIFGVMILEKIEQLRSRLTKPGAETSQKTEGGGE